MPQNKSLTPQREAFAQAIASGLNQSDAYRKTYPNSKNWKPETVWSNASVLMKNSKVLARVDELKAALAEKQIWTREDSVRELKSIVNHKESRAADKTAAIKELNVMHGFNAPQKHEISGPNGIPIPSNMIINIVGFSEVDE